MIINTGSSRIVGTLLLNRGELEAGTKGWIHGKTGGVHILGDDETHSSGARRLGLGSGQNDAVRNGHIRFWINEDGASLLEGAKHSLSGKRDLVLSQVRGAVKGGAAARVDVWGPGGKLTSHSFDHTSQSSDFRRLREDLS